MKPITKQRKATKVAKPKPKAAATRLSTVPSAYVYDIPIRHNQQLVGDKTRITGCEEIELSGCVMTNNTIWGTVEVMPTGWTGTRAAWVSKRYSSFSINSVKMHWLPTVGTTASGTVYLGTMFGTQSFPGGYYTTLAASNGGTAGLLYLPHVCAPVTNGNLHQLLFALNDIDESDLAMRFAFGGYSSVAGPSIPGRIMIEYDLVLHNPRGIEPNADNVGATVRGIVGSAQGPVSAWTNIDGYNYAPMTASYHALIMKVDVGFRYGVNGCDYEVGDPVLVKQVGTTFEIRTMDDNPLWAPAMGAFISVRIFSILESRA